MSKSLCLWKTRIHFLANWSNSSQNSHAYALTCSKPASNHDLNMLFPFAVLTKLLLQPVCCLLSAYLLVFLRADLLNEISHSLALRNLKAKAFKEGDHLFPGSVVHHMPCNTTPPWQHTYTPMNAAAVHDVKQGCHMFPWL